VFTASPHNQQIDSSRKTLALSLFRRVLLVRLGFVIQFNPSTCVCVLHIVVHCVWCVCVRVCVVGVLVEGGVLSAPWDPGQTPGGPRGCPGHRERSQAPGVFAGCPWVFGQTLGTGLVGTLLSASCPGATPASAASSSAMRAM